MTKKREKLIFNRKVKEKIFIAVVLAYPLLHFSIFYIGVNINSILLAFQKYDNDLHLSFAGLSNFVSAFKTIAAGDTLWVSIKNSLLIFGITLVIGMPLNMLFGYYIYKKKFGTFAIRFIIMLPSIVSGMVTALVFMKFVEGALPAIFSTMGVNLPNLLLDAKYNLGIIIFYILWTGFTSSLILYPNAMSGIDMEIIESAKLDGVSQLQELWYIVIPLIYPTITTFMVTGVAAIFTVQGPLFVFYNYDAPANVYNTGYFLFQKVMAGNSLREYPQAAATGLILTLVSAPLTIFVKWIMEKFGPTSDY